MHTRSFAAVAFAFSIACGGCARTMRDAARMAAAEPAIEMPADAPRVLDAAEAVLRRHHAEAIERRPDSLFAVLSLDTWPTLVVVRAEERQGGSVAHLDCVRHTPTQLAREIDPAELAAEIRAELSR